MSQYFFHLFYPSNLIDFFSRFVRIGLIISCLWDDVVAVVVLDWVPGAVDLFFVGNRCLSRHNIMVDAEIRDEVVALWRVFFVFLLQFVVELVLSRHNTCLGSCNISIFSKVWNEVVFLEATRGRRGRPGEEGLALQIDSKSG